MKFTVEIVDLRQALMSVAPHVHRSKDFVQYHRVRLTVDPQNVSVTATNQSTSALAIASLWDSEDGEAGHIDLHPRDVKELLGLFKGTKKSDDEPDAVVEVEATGEHLKVTDVSGLFPGKSLTLPRYPGDDQFPDIAALIGKLLILGAGKTAGVTVSGAELALFAKASAAYGQPLVVDAPVGKSGAMLLSCGESFLGLLRQLRSDPEEVTQAKGWRDAWMRRIGMATEAGES